MGIKGKGAFSLKNNEKSIVRIQHYCESETVHKEGLTHNNNGHFQQHITISDSVMAF